jgi:peptidoglycan/xylan/chitin deacetylase (PgdA/CDA1 family)
MATSLAVITFHAIDDSSSVIAYAPRTFRGVMAALYEAGHRALPLVQVLDCLNRNLPFPDRSFAITFDDGYESVYSQAFPTLQRYGWSATVFLTVGAHGNRTRSERLPSLGGREMLSWDEISEMQRGGITFGAHTLTHPDLTRMPSARVEAEVRDSKSIIEGALGAAVAAFAYPFGRYDRRCRDIVRSHFACACADTLGLLRPQSDLYAMERVDAYYLRTERLFAVMPTRWFPLYVRARALPRGLRRAVRSCVPKGFSRGG